MDINITLEKRENNDSEKIKTQITEKINEDLFFDNINSEVNKRIKLYEDEIGDNELYKDHIKKLKIKFFNEYSKISVMPEEIENFKHNSLPLARIRKIIKEDPDVKMISNDTPNIFSKACELMIMDLAHRAEFFVRASKKKTLQKIDILKAIKKCDTFDFLIDILPNNNN